MAEKKTYGMRWHCYEHKGDLHDTIKIQRVCIMSAQKVQVPPHWWYRFWMRVLLGMRWYEEKDDA